MKRRAFGAGLLAGLAGRAAFGQPIVGSVQQRDLTRLAPKGMLAVSNQVGPNVSIDDQTNNTLNARKVFAAPNSSAITDIVLVYPGWALNPGEINTLAAYTVTAAVEYPAGTFHPAYDANGARSITVTPGIGSVGRFGAVPVSIPAGAKFWIKTFASWTTGHCTMLHGSTKVLVDEWSTRGVGQADLTLSATPQVTAAPDLVNPIGIAPSVFGMLGSTTSVLGVVGDSISVPRYYPDPVMPTAGMIGDAMRGLVPVINTAAGGDTMTNFLAQQSGRQGLLRNSITHLIFSLIRNDINNGQPLVSLQSDLQHSIAPFLTRGVKVWAVTSLPTSTSTDGWATRANQAPAASEAVRQTYNAWLRANYAGIGLSGVLDWAHAVDPADSGVWNADGINVVNGNAQGFATVTAGVVSAVARAQYSGDSSNGANLPVNTALPMVVTAMPGDPGTGAVVTANSNGQVQSYTIVSGGSGYLYPPMISTAGGWTPDGVHPTGRGSYQMIALSGMRPEMFV